MKNTIPLQSEQSAKLLQRYLQQFQEVISSGYANTVRRTINNVVDGVVRSHDIKLRSIAEALDDTICSHSREKQLSRQLNSKRWDAHVALSNYWRLIKRKLGKESTLFVLDTGDIQKPYARTMEGLDYVYDGSTEETGPGYWSIHIHAIDAKGKHYPLLMEPYSVRETGFRSAPAEHQRAWHSVHQAFGRHGVWVLDAGFDNAKHFRWATQNAIAFVIRGYDERWVNADGKRVKLHDLVRGMKLPHTAVLPKYNKKTGTIEHRLVSYGYVNVQLPEQWNPRTRSLESTQLTLIVESRYTNAKGMDPHNAKRVWFYTSMSIANPRDARAVLKLYSRRWSCEEEIRFLKRNFNIEDLRVRTLRSIKKLLALGLLAFALLCYLERLLNCLHRKQYRWILGFAGYSTRHVKFIYYALHKAISKLLPLISPQSVFS